jgi:hypothetical protein
VADVFWRRAATAITIACGLVLAGTALLLFSPSLRARLGFGGPHAPAYVEGDLIDVPRNLYASTSATVLIFARSSCSVCQRAQPSFAASVRQLRTLPGVAVRLVPTGAKSDDEAAYGRAIGLSEAEITPVAVQTLRLRVVPTVVVVDRNGRIQFSAEGVLSGAQEGALRQAAASISGGE